MALLDHQHALKALGLAQVVCDAKQSGITPEFSRPPQKFSSLLAIQPAERFVQNHQTYTRPENRAPQPYALPLASRNQSAAFAQLGLEPIGQLLEDMAEVCRFDGGTDGQREIGIRTLT